MMIQLNPIGIIRTPFKELKGMPIQPKAGIDYKGTIELFDEFIEGIDDLEGFSHIILIYLLHKSRGFKMKVIPFLDSVPRGLFSTRAPRRPNPIGLSVVKLDRVEKGTLYIRDLDILDGTPLLDIKPYVPEFDRETDIKAGWLDKVRKKVTEQRSDGRFIKQTKIQS